jgi:hypothetical protein
MMLIEQLLLVRDWATNYAVPCQVEIEGANSLAFAKFAKEIAP